MKKLIKVIMSFLPMTILALFTVFDVGKATAYDFEVDGIYYNFINSNSVEVTFGTEKYDGLISIPANVSYSSKSYIVTTIGEKAFMYCYGVDYINIPESVTTIDDYAFFNCLSLIDITIPRSVTSIGSHVFDVCLNLENILVDSNNKNFASNSGVLYNKNFEILIQCPAGKESVTIPNSVTKIGANAFYSCSYISSIEIPNSVLYIDDFAFSGCKSLSSIEIPSSVKTIGNFAFEDCPLTSIYIPASVNLIYSGICAGCDLLENINVAPENSSYSSVEGVLYDKNVSTLVQWPGAKTNVIIPSSVNIININAFNGLDNITEVTIPRSITEIGSGAFGYCRNLTSVTSQALSVPLLKTNVFYNIGVNPLLYVYPEVLELYKNSDWAPYFSEILPIEGVKPDDPKLKQIIISPDNDQEIKIGDEVVFTATLIYNNGEGLSLFADGATNAIEWYLSDSNVASLSVSGTNPLQATIKGIAEGYTELTAFATDGSDISATVYITIIKEDEPVIPDPEIPVSSIVITPADAQEIEIDETVTFTASVLPTNATEQNVTWTLTNNQVAVLTVSTINPNSVTVTGIAEGITKLVATSADGNVTSEVEITVVKADEPVIPDPEIPVSSIVITPANAQEIEIDEAVTFTASVLPANATEQDVTWTLTNNQVAILTVSTTNPNSVTVTGIAEGVTKLIATSADGNVTSEVEITVVKADEPVIPDPEIPVSSIVITPADAQEVEIDEAVTFTASVLPANATEQDVTWTLTNNQVAILTVSSTNPNSVTVTGIAEGVTKLVATSADGNVTSEVEITVVKADEPIIPVSSIVINPASAQRIYVDDVISFNATVLPTNATDNIVTWTLTNTQVAELTVSSTDPNVVTVSAFAEGVTNIVATSADGTVRSEVQITIVPAPLPKPVTVAVNFNLDENSGLISAISWMGEETAIRYDSELEGYNVTFPAGYEEETGNLIISFAVNDDNIPFYIVDRIYGTYTDAKTGSVIMVEAYIENDGLSGVVVIPIDALSVNVKFDAKENPVTGIANIKDIPEDIEIYTVSGLRVKDVKNLENGIYIINGKKCMVTK